MQAARLHGAMGEMGAQGCHAGSQGARKGSPWGNQSHSAKGLKSLTPLTSMYASAARSYGVLQQMKPLKKLYWWKLNCWGNLCSYSFKQQLHDSFASKRDTFLLHLHSYMSLWVQLLLIKFWAFWPLNNLSIPVLPIQSFWNYWIIHFK